MLQSSIACSPLLNGLIKIKTQSYYTNQTQPIFHRTKLNSHLKLTNFQPQSPLKPKFPKICVSKVGPLRCGVSSNSNSANVGRRSVREWVEVVGEALSTAFPLWVTIGCVLGLVRPSSFNWVTPKLSLVGLTVIMLGMGMTLTLDDLRSALSMPKEVLSGFFLQYSVSICVLC